MRITNQSLLRLLAASIPLATAQDTRSSKRGLVYVQSKTPSDDLIWTTTGSDLTWYYDYSDASPAGFAPSSLQFVPMLFRLPSSPADTAFEDSIKSQHSSGANITHILSFNEPDGQSSTGGSSISPSDAAQAYISHLLPLRNQGLKIGMPATTGSAQGLTWLQNFNTSCLAINPLGCTADFIPIHWYGNFEGLASYIGLVRSAYPTLPIWVTEFALPGADLSTTQAFFNQSITYLDRLDYVERYSYFGSFRNSASNVGDEAAMLDGKGKLTQIGSVYVFGNTSEKGVRSSADGMGAGGLVGWVLTASGLALMVLFCG